MLLKLDFSSLRQTKWHEYAIRFALGGAITLITGLIAKGFGPVVAGLFLAFPAIFPASATLIERHERERRQRAQARVGIRGRLEAALDARGAALGSLGLMLFGAIVWLFLASYNAAAVVVVALLLWLLVATAAWELRRLIRGSWLSRKPSRSPHPPDCKQSRV